MRALLLLVPLLFASGCFGTCKTLGYAAEVTTWSDLGTIHEALVADGWSVRETEGTAPSYGLGRQHGAFVLENDDGTRTIRLEPTAEEQTVRSVAAPIAERLDAEMTVVPLEHCGTV